MTVEGQRNDIFSDQEGNLKQESEGLFRQVAIEHQIYRLHGDVVFRESNVTGLIIVIIALISIAMALWVGMGSYTRVESAQGMLVPVAGFAKITAPRAGVLVKLFVRDGEMVKAGQRLAIIKVESPDAAGGIGSAAEITSISKQSGLASQQLALSASRFETELARLDGIASSLGNQKVLLLQQVGLQREVVASLASTLDQISAVVERGFISKMDYARRYQNLLAAKEELIRLNQQVNLNNLELSKNASERAQALTQKSSDVIGGRLSLEALNQQSNRLRGEASYLIEAPVTGRITGVQTTEGRSVTTSIPILVIVSDDVPLRADLFLTSSSIGFIRKNQEVRLLYNAFPYQKFGSFVAHVDTISHLAINGSETGTSFDFKEPVFRVTAILERQQVHARGEVYSLQPGMTLSADIILERQSFLDWVMNPLRSAGKLH